MAATQIPLTFRLAPLPIGFSFNPQQLATAIVARLSAVSANAISFFASGSVAPTSNVGPWLKNDQTWYVWSDTLATYVPEILDPQSLGYTFSQSAPDQTKFNIWFKLDGGNDPIGIYIYANGAWKDVYASIIANYSTTAQMNAAITAAVDSQAKYPFSAGNNAAQIFTANAGPIDIVYDNETYDLGNVYNPATSKFTAPVTGVYRLSLGVFFGLQSGAPSDYLVGLIIRKDGPTTIALYADFNEVNTNGRSISVTRDVLLAAGQSAWAQIDITSTGASTWNNDTNDSMNYFQGFLIQAS